MSGGFEVFDWPLTLALSPQAGRGDEGVSAALPSLKRTSGIAARSLLPASRGEGAGRRMRGVFFEKDHQHG